MPWGGTKRKAVLATFPSLVEICGGKHPISLMVTVLWFSCVLVALPDRPCQAQTRVYPETRESEDSQ